MRTSLFVLVLALVASGTERVAAAQQTCDPSRTTGVLCQNPTPVCQGQLLLGLLDYTCAGCTTTPGLLGGSTNNCPTAGETCSQGSCITGCSSSYDGGSVDGGCPEALPYCPVGSSMPSCTQCEANTAKDPFCPTDAPRCNGQSICGCQAGDCTAPATCQVGGGVYGTGVCVVTCSNGAGCASQHCAFDGGVDDDASADGRCVACFTTSDCTDGQVCNVSANTCVTVALDAGPPITVDAGTDGGTLPTVDAGIADAGRTTGEQDATLFDGGSSGEGETDTYPPGKVEGGGCSVLALGAGGGSDSPVPRALLGFAGLAGLFFLRRSQRRSSKGRTERR